MSGYELANELGIGDAGNFPADSIFYRNRAYRGYLYIPGYWGYTIEFTDSIGITYDRSADSYLDINRNLIVFQNLPYLVLQKY